MQRPLQKLFFMFLFFPLYGIGQIKNSGDSLAISFLMKDTIIVDTSQLKLKIIYRNTTNREIDVYRELRVSDHGVNNGNISYEVKCLDDKEWGWRSHCGPAIPYLTYFYTDSLRHFDLPKKKLAAFSSDTLLHDIFEFYNYYKPGKYQLKVYLRVKTIPDLSIFDDTTGEKGQMPFDTLVYLESDWISFRVRKLLSKFHNEDGSIRSVGSASGMPQSGIPGQVVVLSEDRVRLRQKH